MSSILTNTSAMVALQTLKSVNSNLSTVQGEISTGKKVGSAKDNSAVWAISKVMESDVKGFTAISDSLALGESTVAVGRQASETITDLLTEMKGKIVAAQEDNVDRAKIQTDIVALRDQITAVVGAAQFNGLNLVDSTGSATVLGSLDRDASGNVTASQITVNKQDLSIGGYTANDVFSSTAGTASGDGDTVVVSLDNGGGTGDVVVADGTNAWAAGDQISMTIADQTVSYTVSANDVTSGNNAVPDLIAVGLKNAIDSLGISGLTVDYDSANPGQLDFTNAGSEDITVTGQYKNAGSGGLGALSGLDVTTDAAGALASVESLIDTAIDAAAAFGSVEGRISIQADFVSNLTDSLKTGIGAMVDANMEEASARLQALQTQQQLAVQSLSIANQAPQTLLSLFR